MPGDIKAKYVTAVSLISTGPGALAASTTWEAGYSSVGINNGTDLALDFLLSGSFTSATSANRKVGDIRVYAYSSLTGATWPDLFSVGAEGSEGAATVHDTEQRDNHMLLVRAIVADDGSSEVYSFPSTSICSVYGSIVPPERFNLWITHNIATSTNAGFASTGHSLYAQPIYAQYT